MKSLILLLVIPLTFSFSQNKEICIENLSIFAESAKVKNYDEAYKPWIDVKDECPDLNLAIYSYGERILKSKIKNAQPEDIDNFKNQLIELYDQWLIYFPSKRGISVVGDILSSKAQSMIDYKVGSPSEIYEVFDKHSLLILKALLILKDYIIILRHYIISTRNQAMFPPKNFLRNMKRYLKNLSLRVKI